MTVQFFMLFCLINFVFLIVVSMGMLYAQKKKEAASHASVLDRIRAEEQKLQAVLDELSNVATVVHGDIEAKEKSLRALLQTVDEKMAVLSAHKAVGGRSKGVATPHRRLREASVATTGTQEEGDAVPLTDSDKQRIFDLADQGYKILDIAKRLKKPKGEVELMLHLRNVREAAYAKST